MPDLSARAQAAMLALAHDETERLLLFAAGLAPLDPDLLERLAGERNDRLHEVPPEDQDEERAVISLLMAAADFKRCAAHCAEARLSKPTRRLS